MAGPTAPVAAPASTAGVDTLSLGAAGYAKIVCSAVFVSGRDPAEARRNSTYFVVSDADREAVSGVDVDRQRLRVRVTLRDGRTRTAGYYGDQGCVILPEGRDGVFFTPRAVRSTLLDAARQPWPMGDAPAAAPWPPEVDRASLDAAVDRAFAPDALTAAFLVVYRGQIVAERYMPGIGKDTQLESWSMGKSIIATLVGILVRDGTYRVEDPAPIPAWQRPGDGRSRIRIIDLLRMSSGLRCTSPFDPDYAPASGYPDHLFIYTGAIDAYAYAIARPLQFRPNTEGRYRNCDPLAAASLVEQAVRRRGEDMLTFPQRALFDRIGIRRQVLETDPYGHFLLPGYDYGTARNWARLGLLYLQQGLWQGERILPEGWSRLVSTPAPAWKRPVYGAYFWLNRDARLAVPRDAYFMSGAGGQTTLIVPDRELVVVRLGHQRGERHHLTALNEALVGILAAIHHP